MTTTINLATQTKGLLATDKLAPAVADFNMNSHKITNVTDPASAQDAATKAYVDSVGSLTAANFGSFVNGLAAKTTPVNADLMDLVDSADSNNAKKITWANVKDTLKTYFDTVYQAILTASNLHTLVDSLTAMTTPVDADRMIIVDNSASLAKKITWANIKATLKTYFDGLYQPTISFGSGVLTALDINVGSAGSVVVNGGALGTPSSGNLSNCTGVTAVNGQDITVSNNSIDAVNDINFSGGFFPFSDNTGGAVLAAKIKRLDAAWAAGTNQGGLFSGTKANATTYHLFAIYKAADGSTDCGFDTSVTAANIPSGYTKYKRVLSLYTDSGGNWVAFQQIGKYVNLKVQSVSRAYAAASNSTVNALTMAVPSGIQVRVNVMGRANSGGTDYLNLQNPFETDATPTVDNCVAAAVSGASYQTEVVTNTSSQINTRATSTSLIFGVLLRGWTDLTL